MSDLDLNEFLKEGALADLDWLDIDEEEYRKTSPLPKQNLDIVPDLEFLWAHDDKAQINLVPNYVSIPNPGIEDPHAMIDMGQAGAKERKSQTKPHMIQLLASEGAKIAKVARYALMQSDDMGRLKDELVKRFGMEPLRQHRDVLASVLEERGLLGRLYVNASDFPTCQQGTKSSSFVSKYASTAQYVVKKKACGGCVHATTTAAGQEVCGQFHKELKVEVPFTDKLASKVEALQAARGRNVQASAGDAKERIRAAFLAPVVNAVSGEAYEGYGISRVAAPEVQSAEVVQQQLISASSLLRKKQSDTDLALKAAPILKHLNREMLKGASHSELVDSLKSKFDATTLVATSTEWKPLLQESGLYGVVYTKQASFDDCHEGANFLTHNNPGVRAIVAGDKCGSCIYSKGMCMLYGKKLVKSASEIMTQETVDAVLWEHRTAGRLQSWDTKTASTWGSTPAKALKAIHAAVKSSATEVRTAAPRMGFMAGFHGQLSSQPITSGLTIREITKTASRLMNEGLYGTDLLNSLQARFDPADLVAAKDDLRVVLAEQGLQGIYYVDPTIYEDYGRGCKEASRLHGTRLVEYVKIGSKCDTCVHQRTAGYCSQINKPLVVEPPYVNKTAQQREILASGASTVISYESLVNNGTSMLSEYQMQQPLQVDVNASLETPSYDIELGVTGKVKI